MASNTGVAFIFALVFVSPLAAAVLSDAMEVSETRTLRPTGNVYDYYQLVLQWPPSVCSSTLAGDCAVSYEKRFVLHGFWPLPFSGITWCDGPPFNITKIEHIRPQLSKVWYDFIAGKDEALWKLQWQMHGVCSVTRFDQTDYFELALNIKNNRLYSVLDIVQSVGITPKESNPLWKRDRFFNAVLWRLGKRPILRCNQNKYTNQYQLSEAVLCFARDGIQLINCPVVGNCPEFFTWPTNANPPPPPSPPAGLFSIVGV